MPKYNQKKRDISKNPRKHDFKIRLNDTEYERIKMLYGDQQMAPTARKILLDHIAGGSSVSSELRLLREEVSRIGNNVNQIAKALNSGENSDISGLKNFIYQIKKSINKKLLIIR
ncbi:plasmid mobilization relaxosome protein MobC [Zymomonas mobilis]|uniref:plasmid mobilization relaxosome protein MobC n=1 Tax=Zymomonas mobilis TaxID=542 RepID=UPI0039EA395C